VRNTIGNSPMLASAPLARRELGWLVNSAALACFPNSTLDAGSIVYSGDTPQPLRRALAFIDEHAGDPITLDEIAAAARLSPAACTLGSAGTWIPLRWPICVAYEWNVRTAICKVPSRATA
jgi:hypothetical protein